MRSTLAETLEKAGHTETEKLLQIKYLPQAKFRVQAVTRCSSSIPGMQRCTHSLSGCVI